MPDDERPLFEELLDYLFYAPIGAVSQVVTDFPALVEQGRQRFETRMNAARVTGRFAVATLRRRVEDLAGPAPAAPARPPVAEPDIAVPVGIDPVDLAIPGYDTLAASQVVARLVGLSPEERAAVRAYEEATRARRTILGRIAQLDADLGD